LSLVDRLEELSKLKSLREKDLESTRGRYESRCSILEEQIAHVSEELKELSDELELQSTDISEAGNLDGENPPGPRCLWWVEGQPFGFIVSLIVSLNIIVIFVERGVIFHETEQMKGLLHWADHGFLIFYLLEMCLKLMLWHRRVFMGRPCERIWTNWLDAFIILMAIIEQWIVALVAPGHEGGHGLGALRILRLARLLRCCKFLGAFLQADLQWAEGEKFTLFMMCVIGMNCMSFGIEADFPAWGGWIYIENLFLVIFLFELAVRLRFRRLSFFNSSDWAFNWLDFFIVLGGMLNMWALPCASLIGSLMGRDFDASAGFGEALRFLRLFRLVRLLRLVRLVRSLPPLFNLLVGILRAMQGMLWIGILTLVSIYVLALLCIKLVGPRGLVMNDSVPDEVQCFPTSGRTMWLLFLAMNGWTDQMMPLLNYFPTGLLLLAAYIVFARFTVKSVLTAVICDRMAAVSEETSADEIVEEQAKLLNKKRCKLGELYDTVDTSASGSIDRDEFNRLVRDEDKSDDLCDLVSMDKLELPSLWQALAKGERVIEHGGQRMEVESILRDDFIEGLLAKSHAVKEFCFLRLEKRMAVMERLMMKIVDALNSNDGQLYLSSASLVSG